MIVFPDKADVAASLRPGSLLNCCVRSLGGGGGGACNVCVSKTEMRLTNIGSKGRFRQ